jgi:hypothetical protein
MHLLPSLGYAIFMIKENALHFTGFIKFYDHLFHYFKRVIDLLHVKLTSTLRLSPKQYILTSNRSVFAVSKTSKQLHKQKSKKKKFEIMCKCGTNISSLV